MMVFLLSQANAALWFLVAHVAWVWFVNSCTCVFGWWAVSRNNKEIRRINGNLCKAIVEANSRWGVAMNALQAERRKK